MLLLFSFKIGVFTRPCRPKCLHLKWTVKIFLGSSNVVEHLALALASHVELKAQSQSLPNLELTYKIPQLLHNQKKSETSASRKHHINKKKHNLRLFLSTVLFLLCYPLSTQPQSHGQYE